MSEQMNDEQLEQVVQKILCKLTEISSMMKNGEFIVAYEKLGGVQKNITQVGSVLQQRRPKTAV